MLMHKWNFMLLWKNSYLPLLCCAYIFHSTLLAKHTMPVWLLVPLLPFLLHNGQIGKLLGMVMRTCL